MPPLVLASGSPRRRQFLTDLGFDFQVVPSNADETQLAGEPAAIYAQRLARSKAAAVAKQVPGSVVLAADTIVVRDGEVLGKPENEADFRRMMQLLSGRTHDVITAVAIHRPDGHHAEIAVDTRVTFRTLSEGEIRWYWHTGEPKDKAGGYAIQGKGGAFITTISGSHSNVIGLPLVETLTLLESAGVRPPWSQP